MTTSTEPRTINWVPNSLADHAMVTDQLERILSSPLFRQSKRYSPFLRYVVEKTLAGERDTLKERTLGVEVFGRDPLYDSNNDPVVRVTSGEVRRRIAQYYHEPGREHELRIDLTPGSYVPEFLPPNEPRQVKPAALVSPQIDLVGKGPSITKRKLAITLVGLLSVFALLLFVLHWRTQNRSAIEQWWQPALHSPSPVLLSVGMISSVVTGTPSSPPESNSVDGHSQKPDHVGLIDAVALERIASLLSIKEQSYRTLSSVSTTYNDLRAGPVVLVAGFNNPWTLRITDPLRFHFATLPNSRIAMITDRQHPDNTEWRMDFSQSHSQVTRDYAIIARLHDATSEKPVFVAAGIGGNGTDAAAEFLTTESTLHSLISQLPTHWEDRNVEAVIQTRVIDGQAGPPKLVSIQVW